MRTGSTGDNDASSPETFVGRKAARALYLRLEPADTDYRRIQREKSRRLLVSSLVVCAILLVAIALWLLSRL